MFLGVSVPGFDPPTYIPLGGIPPIPLGGTPWMGTDQLSSHPSRLALDLRANLYDFGPFLGGVWSLSALAHKINTEFTSEGHISGFLAANDGVRT